MKWLFGSKTPRAPIADSPPSPRQLYDEAAADTDYSRKACLRSLSSRKIFLTGGAAGPSQTIPPGGGTAAGWKGLPSGPPASQTDSDSQSYAVASITFAEPGQWQGKKAHFVRLNVAFYPDSHHYLERVNLTIRVWKAGDALKSIRSISDTPVLSVEPPHAPEFADDAPGIVLFGPRAVIGRPAGTVEPFWEGHLQPGEHFVYFADAVPPINLASAGRMNNTQPRSLLRIVAFGDDSERYPPPPFNIGLVVLSDGKPFDLTASSTSIHWGLPPVCRYLYTPYKPARFTSTTRLIPKGEKRIRMDFAKAGMRDRLKEMMGWATTFETIWFGCADGCLDKPTSPGRSCSLDYCKVCKESCNAYRQRSNAEASGV